MRSLDALRAACEQALRHERRRILVCAGTGCVSSGSLKVYEALRGLMLERGIDCSV